MFNLNNTIHYFLCTGRTNMRRGISSLCEMAYIFTSSNRRRMKQLHIKNGGMMMYVKRLVAGRFKLLEYDSGSNSYSME